MKLKISIAFIVYLLGSASSDLFRPDANAAYFLHDLDCPTGYNQPNPELVQEGDIHGPISAGHGAILSRENGVLYCSVNVGHKTGIFDVVVNFNVTPPDTQLRHGQRVYFESALTSIVRKPSTWFMTTALICRIIARQSIELLSFINSIQAIKTDSAMVRRRLAFHFVVPMSTG